MNKSFKLPVVILANGSFPTHHIPIEQLKAAGTVICTDGAANYLSKLNLIPHVIIGAVSYTHLTLPTNREV